MKLIKLEINGFKSFYNKTEISFPTGTTAIIGPNGSGKSNISDAVRWVLGEQSAKALRGTKMEDVIFNGTQMKRARSFCEVILTFDNADGSLRCPYSEVAVLRRCYRSGESEYAINDVACRMRDIVDLFRDTGIGKEGYSIIGQGKVEEILSNKSNERRNAVDEAAGIMRFRVRKEEAERKLISTDENLARLNDIRAEIEQRLLPLREQSEQARAYLSLRDELRDLELNLCLIQYDKQQQKISSLKNEAQLLKEEESAAAEREAAVLSGCEKEEETIKSIEDTLYRQQNTLMELLSGVESHIGDTKLLTERKDNASRQILLNSEQTELLTEKKDRISAALDELSQDASLNDEMEETLLCVEHTEEELFAAEKFCNDTESLLDEKKAEMMNAMNRLAEAKSGLSRYETMLASLNERLNQISSESAEENDKLLLLRAELTKFDVESDDLSVKKKDLKNSLAETQSEKEKTEKEYADCQTALRGDEQEISSVRSRLTLLEEMIASHDGYFTSVKKILSDMKTSEDLNRRIVGVVAELLSVPDQYETAVTSALGSALQNIVVQDAEDAKYVIEYLRAHGYGRATFLPITMIREGKLTETERDMIDIPGCFGVASELVNCDQTLTKVKEHLLGRTVIVKDMDIGISLSKKTKNAFYIVTLSGDIISVSGSMTGGSTHNNSLSLLGRDKELSRLRSIISSKEKLLKQTKEKTEVLKNSIILLGIQYDSLNNEIHDAEIMLSRRAEQRLLITHDISLSDSKIEALENEKRALEESVTEIELNIKRSACVQEEIETHNIVSVSDVKELQKELINARKNRDAIAEKLTQQRVALVRIEGRIHEKEKERDHLMAEENEIIQSIGKYEKEIELLTGQIAETDTELERLFSSVENEQNNVSLIKTEQLRWEEEKSNHIRALSEARSSLDSLRSEILVIRDRQHKVEMDISKNETECSALLDRIWRDYEMTYEHAAEYRHPIAITSSTARIADIKNSMREMGNVNINAIEEYETVNERYTELSRQCDDLYSASYDLKSLIHDLTISMEREFRDRFSVIQSNFTAVFRDLFGGGTAEIKLSDEKDVLGSDIEIIAQPPGKKLQLLTLLSGGERALTAIALVFALLKIKPPAFCILDEIESSLDEANVTRFAEYVRSLSDTTQFVLITHRKGSMEVCGALYGVSMEEKGISKVVSAKFNKEG